MIIWLILNVAKLQKKSLADLEEIQRILSTILGLLQNSVPCRRKSLPSVFEGKDTLALMPTGGGKSITFQVPSLAMEGICLVITPLIALMKDQVDQLVTKKNKGIGHSFRNDPE